MNKISMPVFFTENERKRIRRLRRQEKEKDKQEKIRLGLLEPDPPKLKFNNFMRILGDSAVQDPSQVEKLVRKAYEERYKKMMAENEKNKLTKEQKGEKVRKKFERDIKKDCKACLFKIPDLYDRKIKYKIDKNAQQLYLTGICIANKRSNMDRIPTLIYVEGGPLALKKYKNLLLRRIKWGQKENNIDKTGDKEIYQNNNEENNVNQNENDLKLKENKSSLSFTFNQNANLNNDDNVKKDSMECKNSKDCMLVWEGTLKKRSFEKWKLMEVTSEIRARKILSDKGMEHYWNLLISYNFDE
jgi:U4/U6 small nuclear ribonucleoprotein PRP3